MFRKHWKLISCAIVVLSASIILLFHFLSHSGTHFPIETIDLKTERNVNRDTASARLTIALEYLDCFLNEYEALVRENILPEYADSFSVVQQDVVDETQTLHVFTHLSAYVWLNKNESGIWLHPNTTTEIYGTYSFVPPQVQILLSSANSDTLQSDTVQELVKQYHESHGMIDTRSSNLGLFMGRYPLALTKPRFIRMTDSSIVFFRNPSFYYLGKETPTYLGLIILIGSDNFERYKKDAKYHAGRYFSGVAWSWFNYSQRYRQFLAQAELSGMIDTIQAIEQPTSVPELSKTIALLRERAAAYGLSTAFADSVYTWYADQPTILWRTNNKTELILQWTILNFLFLIAVILVNLFVPHKSTWVWIVGSCIAVVNGAIWGKVEEHLSLLQYLLSCVPALIALIFLKISYPSRKKTLGKSARIPRKGQFGD